jgi:hypothetical protein
MTDEYGAEVATSVETIEGTWSINGQTFKLQTKDTRKETLDLIEEYMEVAQTVDSAEDESDIPEGLGKDIDNFSWEDEDSDTDMVESVIGEKLVKPEVDVSQVPQRKLGALFEGMMEAWQEGEQVKSAKAEMPVSEGN